MPFIYVRVVGKSKTYVEPKGTLTSGTRPGRQKETEIDKLAS